jgi:hypothetical protein
MLNMRTVMINTIGEDYVTMAHAKGLRDRAVMTALRGAKRDPAAAERVRRALRERRSAGSSSSSTSSATPAPA